MASTRARGRATAADIEDERQEVVGGELVWKAAPTFDHGDLQGAIFGHLVGFRGYGRPGGWWLGTEVEVELGPHEVYLPDIVGWRMERVPDRPRGKPVRVAPDWVCEILSPSTASRDLGHKQRNYHLARVGHYWVVDPDQQSLTVFRWREASYEVAMSARVGDTVGVEPFDAISLDLSNIFGRAPDAS
jgi:Uma2 family endonuclease